VTKPTNWAGNITFRAAQIHRPATRDELRRIVSRSARVRAIGSGHSFTDIADSPGDLVSLADLPQEMDVDTGGATVRVSGGLRYSDLCGRLHEKGWALHNLGSLPHISIVGSCATATHGSGDRNGNLATMVAALELVTATGDIVTLRRGDPGFDGAVVGLGALGVVAAVTLDLVPTFDARQHVYEGLALEVLEERFDEIVSAPYSVSLFTRWRDTSIDQVWVKSTDPWPAGQEWHGARLADGPRHPLPGMPTVNCTEQMGVPGPWHERLPHFRPDFTPSSGEELQSEYLVPRRHAVEALRALAGLRERIAPVLQVCEIRTVAADRLWMSSAYGQDVVALHFTWHKDIEGVLPVISLIEERLTSLAPRPHWGKLFTMPPETLRSRYERFPDFAALVRHHDPAGKFGNDFLTRHLFG
jgi:xylitol oxidase